MIQRHMALKQKYPNRPDSWRALRGNRESRPETVKLVEVFKLGQPQKD